MAFDAIDYGVRSNLGNNDRLFVYYDFASGSGTQLVYIEEEGDDVTWSFGCITNQYPASNTGLFSGIVTDSMTENIPDTRLYTTGTFLKPSGLADLTKSNLKVRTASNLDYSSVSTLFDVQFSGSIDDGVLFGALEKTSNTINGEVVTGAKGFNFGVNDRGKMFYQGFDERGDFIYTANSIELSKRNLLGFSVSSNSVEITRIDYLNQRTQSETFRINDDYAANNEEFYLGGSENYFRSTSGEFRTFSGQLREFALFSGYLSPSLMMSIGSGMIGEYFFSSGASTTREEVTGYSETIVYRTGITGYDFNVTGTLTISTGRDMQTGSSAEGVSQSVIEGDKYYKYYTLDNGDVKTFYKEEIGYLDLSSGYTYVPTGSGAFATLGLSNVGANIATHVETEGVDSAGTVTMNLYESVIMTGTLNEISGVTQTALTKSIDVPAIPVSGITLSGDSEAIKKNYIYYLGQRL